VTVPDLQPPDSTGLTTEDASDRIPLRSVAVLVHSPVSMFEFGVACEVFGVDRTVDGLPGFDFAVCTSTPGRVPAGHAVGVDLTVRLGLQALTGADLVIVAPPGERTVPSPAVVRALHGAVDSGARVMSMCSGSFILARAGLLDGRRATTHWYHADSFRAEFPHIELVPDVLYVEDGRVATSAGTAAAVDLCLHLVRRAHGAAAASGIARRMVVPPHRDGGQAQFVRSPVAPCTADTLAGVLEWAQAHLHEDLSVSSLARQAVMSERTFARRFRDETGTTPHHWVTAQRIALAEQLLEGGTESIEEVARRCGFASADMLRHHFTRLRSTTPTAFRRTFGGA
jgi:AraC family transcriptional regulator, transcriptional activator FtrA